MPYPFSMGVTLPGEAFPCVHSIEVAHELKMNAREVEIIAKDIKGIKTHLTINGEYYEA